MQASSSTGAARNARGQSLGRTASEKVASRVLASLLPGTPCTHQVPLEDERYSLEGSHPEAGICRVLTFLSAACACKRIGLQKLEVTRLQADNFRIGNLRSRRDSDSAYQAGRHKSNVPDGGIQRAALQ